MGNKKQPTEKQIKKMQKAKAAQKNKRAKIASDISGELKIINENTPFNIKEAYKTTRTNIMFSLASKGEGCKVILITSSVPGEGKSVTAINTALTFAQTGAKVLMIDGDLRKAKLHRYMKVSNTSGLSELLGGFAKLETVLKKSELYDIDYITAGHTPPNPLELLSSDKMKDVIKTLSERYDYIFIDTPPVNLVADTTAISPIGDGLIVVVRHKFTTHDMLYKALSSLEFANAKVLGFIFNDVDSSDYAYSTASRYGKYSYRNYK